jgi:hypothetical protein
MKRILKENTTNFNELEALNQYLNGKGINLHQTINNGIIYEMNGKFYKYDQEEQYPETLPPLIEGKYIECDQFGHTDYYN